MTAVCCGVWLLAAVLMAVLVLSLCRMNATCETWQYREEVDDG